MPPAAVDLPELTPPDAALLAQFRVDESPTADTLDRVHRRLRARISQADEIAPSLLSRWGLWLRAGGLSVAIAAAVLLLLAGGSRVLGTLATPAAPAAASDSLRGEAAGGELESRVPPTQEVALPPAVAPTSAAPEPASTLPAATLPIVPTAQPVGETSRRTPVRGKTSPAASKPADAAAEIALLSAARSERDPQARLELVARHHREFAGGKLVQEIAVLEIQTLCKLGRRDDARAHASSFAERHPGSAYAAIAARACEESGR